MVLLPPYCWSLVLLVVGVTLPLPVRVCALQMFVVRGSATLRLLFARCPVGWSLHMSYGITLLGGVLFRLLPASGS